MSENEIRPTKEKTYKSYIAWKKAYLRSIGEELARKFPDFWGKINFNIQNGKFINWNFEESGK